MPKEQSSSATSLDSKTYDVSHHEYSEKTHSNPADVREDGLPVSHMSYGAKGRSWRTYRNTLREYAAEFFGVMILIIFGNGVNCQVVLGGNEAVSAAAQGSYLSINFGWGIGTAMGVWISGGISGGHINPAVTLALATTRGFPWKKVPGYILAQILGGIAGASIVYGNYAQALNLVEGGRNVRTELTRGLFATYPSQYLSPAGCFFSEFLGTVVLMLMVMAINDKKNCPTPAGLAPLFLFLLVTGLGTSLGMQTAYAINPARDLGPRIMTAMAGWGADVFTFRNHYWLWCPFLGPVLGAQFASVVYDAFLYTGNESPISKMFDETAPQTRRNPPAGPGAEDNC